MVERRLNKSLPYCHLDIQSLVTEYVGGFSVERTLKLFPRKRLPEVIARTYFRQLISAVITLYDHDILIREIKIESLQLTPDMRHIKIVDFSSAVLLPPPSDLSNKELTPEYSAPELLEGCENFRAEICVWNLGIILYYLIVGTLPFQSPYFDHNRRKRIMRFTARGLTYKHAQAMQHLTQTCKVFLRQTIEPKAILRIPLWEVPQNEWVTHQGKLVFQPFRPCGMHIKSEFETACVSL
ncbi:unnamed protein product [Dibothriocephalus latus]|uniref:Protein kinase domain-containing protein n=1 Tax=Dibothriocephalus latus TaxID=60516 RepID=A0A3P7LR06_DIBLA|nr:unnamed protein product [Dibothriocephalus latus]